MKSISLSVLTMILATHAIADDEPPVPKTPAGVGDLVFARPFTLAKGYQFDWGLNPRLVTSGTLVVLKVDPALVFPRNSAEPVLYAGDQVVQRLNQGHESGRVIGIVPGTVDLAKAAFWFGRPELPERVNPRTIRTEWAAAEKAGVRPFAADKVERAVQKPLQSADLSALLRDHAAELVLEHSPQEKGLAETWRLPVARPLPKPR